MIERRVFICRMNRISAQVPQFYSLYCQFKLLEAKIDSRSLKNPMQEVEQLHRNYSQLRKSTIDELAKRETKDVEETKN